jgi:hypothetical protein
MRLQVDVAPGEALDTLTMLDIKEAKIADPQKLRHVQPELLLLREATRPLRRIQPDLAPIIDEPRSVTAKLGAVGDLHRSLERTRSFGRDVVRLARDAGITHARRASLRARINTLHGTDSAGQTIHAA